MSNCPNPNCQTENPNDARYCHMCGSRLVKSTNTKGIIIATLIILAVIAGMVILYNSTEINYEQRVRNVVQTLCDAIVNNDYNRISELYAFNVKRYHSIYDATNAEVVKRYKNYDSKFRVHSKQASVRWNTLQIWKNTNGYSVVYIEDYHIERENKSKYSDFVLEKHIELNTDFKIVSEYDVQLSKSK